MKAFFKLLSLFCFVLSASSAIGGGQFEFRYWRASWSRPSTSLHNKYGMLGFDWRGSGVSGFGGFSAMAGECGMDGVSFWRIDTSLTVGHWFVNPFVGGFLGYTAVGVDASDLENTVFLESAESSFSDWEVLHGPVLGFKGAIPLRYFFGEGKEPALDVAAYYRGAFTPILMADSTHDGVHVKSRDGRAWDAEVGLVLLHDTMPNRKGGRLILRCGWRHQEILSSKTKNDRISGIVLGLSF